MWLSSLNFTQQIHLLNPAAVLRHFHVLEFGVVDFHAILKVKVYLLMGDASNYLVVCAAFVASGLYGVLLFLKDCLFSYVICFVDCGFLVINLGLVPLALLVMLHFQKQKRHIFDIGRAFLLHLLITVLAFCFLGFVTRYHFHNVGYIAIQGSANPSHNIHSYGLVF